jgi:hypothetical protein
VIEAVSQLGRTWDVDDGSLMLLEAWWGFSAMVLSHCETLFVLRLPYSCTDQRSPGCRYDTSYVMHVHGGGPHCYYRVIGNPRSQTHAFEIWLTLWECDVSSRLRKASWLKSVDWSEPNAVCGRSSPMASSGNLCKRAENSSFIFTLRIGTDKQAQQGNRSLGRSQYPSASHSSKAFKRQRWRYDFAPLPAEEPLPQSTCA